ncbi:MAG: hypothetical protein WCE51_08215 [Chthoniobacterales bacterium]
MSSRGPERTSVATIPKFMPQEKGGNAPELSKRRKIIVIADEAHRSQYELMTTASHVSPRLA